jgi:hypothetical protein
MAVLEHHPGSWGTCAGRRQNCWPPVFVATIPAAQDVDVLIVVRAGMMRDADHHLPVAFPERGSVVPLPIAGSMPAPGTGRHQRILLFTRADGQDCSAPLT